MAAGINSAEEEEATRAGAARVDTRFGGVGKDVAEMVAGRWSRVEWKLPKWIWQNLHWFLLLEFWTSYAEENFVIEICWCWAQFVIVFLSEAMTAPFRWFEMLGRNRARALVWIFNRWLLSIWIGLVRLLMENKGRLPASDLKPEKMIMSSVFKVFFHLSIRGSDQPILAPVAGSEEETRGTTTAKCAYWSGKMRP